MDTENGTLRTKIGKVEWTCGIAMEHLEDNHSWDTVLHCFKLGASQQFYRHLVGLKKKLGTDKKVQAELAKHPFAPSAPRKKLPGQAILDKMDPEERLAYGLQIQEEATQAINQGVDEDGTKEGEAAIAGMQGEGQLPPEEVE